MRPVAWAAASKIEQAYPEGPCSSKQGWKWCADHREVKARPLGVDQVIDEVLGRALLAHHRVAYLCQLRTSLGIDRRGTTFVPICLDILRRRPLYSSQPR